MTGEPGCSPTVCSRRLAQDNFSLHRPSLVGNTTPTPNSLNGGIIFRLFGARLLLFRLLSVDLCLEYCWSHTRPARSCTILHWFPGGGVMPEFSIILAPGLRSHAGYAGDILVWIGCIFILQAQILNGSWLWLSILAGLAIGLDCSPATQWR